ncbi:MAG TPA: PAN domain-containing protein [Kofleriaceae bacterium]
MTMFRMTAVVALAAMVSGCAAMEGEPEASAIGDDLLGGVATDARPEIGSYSRGCTATLIAPRWVLTAGHCTSYSPVVAAGDSFTVTRGLDGLAHSFAVDRMHIFGAFAAAGAFNSIAFENTPDETGTNDVAILHLATAVPASIAVPARIADGPPPSGTTVTVFGYGCRNRDGSGGGFKQAVTYTYPSSNVLCPGDSGGPVVIGEANGGGAVFQVNTGFISSIFTSWDVHGEATYFRDDIMSVIRRVDASLLEVGFDRPGSDYTSFPAALASSCQSACINDGRCHAFTFDPGGTCWLKSAVPSWVPCVGCTSGISFQQEASTNRGGSDMQFVDLGSKPAEACMSLCSTTPLCASYTYVAATASQTAQCWLKNAIPATSTLFGATSGVRRAFEQSTNRAGWDYSDFDVANAPQACATSCATDARCRAFTFTDAGVGGRSSAHCWLKSSVPSPSAMTGAVSGVKRGLEQETNRAGTDFDNFDLPHAVPEECQARCAQDSRCLAFTYVAPGFNGASQPNAHCWLKSSVTSPSAGTGLVSGVRGGDFF